MAGGSVVRSYSPAPETWKPGDIVTVTLTYSLPNDAPEGAYELTDTLPSGLRYLERPWAYGQRVDWSVYSSLDPARGRTAGDLLGGEEGEADSVSRPGGFGRPSTGLRRPCCSIRAAAWSTA